MRKYLTIGIVIITAILGLRYLVYYQGIYIDFHPDEEIVAASKAEGKNVMVYNEDGEYSRLQVKGVAVDSSIPGEYATDFAVDEEQYLDWFSMIQDMGANTIRVNTIMDEDFYNALYEFNNKSRQPLYLLQGLWVTDYANNSAEDAYDDDFYGTLKKDAISAVDIIHGRKNIPFNSVKGSGSYRKDVSPWVLGYILGAEWNAKTIAYTNHRYKDDAGFDGKYISTSDDASAFESMLAKIAESVFSYESKKYKEQRLLSFVGDPSIDPFEYEEEYGRQIEKYVQLDPEHLVAEDTVESGLFAAYQLYEFCPGFADRFSERQKSNLESILNKLDKSYYYEGYTQLLSDYHTMPVIISGYGFSTARGVENAQALTGREAGPLTEEEQGEALVDTYQDIVDSGCAGAVITSWQDVWGQRTWNTQYAVDVTNVVYWSDAQSSDQGYGILAFDPGKEKSVCYVDGDIREWEGKEPVLTKDDGKLFGMYDEKYLYLMIQKEGISEEEEYYIPIDTTSKTGSMSDKERKLEFERAADFLLCVNGEDNTRLLVQSRYESLRENYLLETQGKDPFIKYPDKDDPQFVNINMILKLTGVVENAFDESGIRVRRLADVFETGKLVNGDGNPSSDDYLSTADFCYGEDCLEIRIPWQLLNFSDPSTMKIHDDYYKNYGVENIKIRNIYLGIGESGEMTEIPMSAMRLKGWRKSPSYHERLKKSYKIVRNYWTESAIYGN